MKFVTLDELARVSKPAIRPGEIAFACLAARTEVLSTLRFMREGCLKKRKRKKEEKRESQATG